MVFKKVGAGGRKLGRCRCGWGETRATWTKLLSPAPAKRSPATRTRKPHFTLHQQPAKSSLPPWRRMTASQRLAFSKAKSRDRPGSFITVGALNQDGATGGLVRGRLIDHISLSHARGHPICFCTPRGPGRASAGRVPQRDWVNCITTFCGQTRPRNDAHATRLR